MKNMKRTLFLLLAVAALSSCFHSRAIKEAGILTDQFLAAYCGGDFQTAADFCREPLKSHILKAADITADIDTTLTGTATSILESLTWEKTPVETEGKTDKITFTCTTSFKGQTLTYTVSLTPVEKSWLISAIN